MNTLSEKIINLCNESHTDFRTISEHKTEEQLQDSGNNIDSNKEEIILLK